MTATPTTAEPANPPDQPAEPTRSERLLSFLRKIVEFGLNLRKALLGESETETPDGVHSRYGTDNTKAILGRIAHALRLAAELEQRVIKGAASMDRPRPKRDPWSPEPEQPPPEAPPPSETAIPIRLPTARQIATRLREKSIGAVIAEICYELGICFEDELWLRFYHVLCDHRGPLMKLIRALHKRDRFTGFIPGYHLPWPRPAAAAATTPGASPPLASAVPRPP